MERHYAGNLLHAHSPGTPQVRFTDEEIGTLRRASQTLQELSRLIEGMELEELQARLEHAIETLDGLARQGRVVLLT